MSGTGATDGRLGAVLRAAGEPSPAALGPDGPYVVTSLEHAREVLTAPDRFDFPADVSRQRVRRQAATARERGPQSPHTTTTPLRAEQVDSGMATFASEIEGLRATVDDQVVDLMTLLREPVARATTDAVLPGIDPAGRDRVADLVLGWIDALGPVIASPRNPRRWSGVRRRERAARGDLEQALAEVGADRPAMTGTVLAAGIQVPIAAGSWLFVKLAEDRAVADWARARAERARLVAWETIRVCPPTWITARITTDDVELGRHRLAPGSVVMVSPLLLGRLEELAPGPARDQQPLDSFDPRRWEQDQVKPGAWLPFGAGPHACPGRNLGLAMLTGLAEWAAGWRLTLAEPAVLDQSRGIFPRPARVRFEPC